MSKEMNYNVADEKAVAKGRAKAKEKRRRELNDLKSTLSHPYGRRLIWRLMEKCKTFGSVWEQSSKIHYNAGQQDIGHFIMAEIVEADENLLLKMMKENKEKN